MERSKTQCNFITHQSIVPFSTTMALTSVKAKLTHCLGSFMSIRAYHVSQYGRGKKFIDKY